MIFGGGEPEEWALKGLPPRPFIIDVGANVGDFSRLAFRVCPDADVTAFEPNPECHSELLRSGAHVVRAAVGSACGVATLYYTEGPCELGSLGRRRLEEIGPGYAEGTHGKSRATVSVVTLDGCYGGPFSPHIDLLKVDVEGHEEGVFAGARRLLAAGRVGRILFEFGTEWQFEDGFQPSLPRVVETLGPTHAVYMWTNWNEPDVETGLTLVTDPQALQDQKVFSMFSAVPA